MTFLIVEDEPLTASLLASSLIVAKHNVYVVRNLSEAMDAASFMQPDAILLDLNLPDSHASRTVEAIPILQSKTPISAITVLTGCLTDALRERSEALGAVAVMEKGKFTTGDVCAVALDAIHRKCGMSETLEVAERILGQSI